jgi:polysaccharide biosynthesis/export protein
MNHKCHWLVVLLLGWSLFLCGCASGPKDKNANLDEHSRLTQIETYYQAGKADMGKGLYPSAIVNFNHVIDLENNFAAIYTSYAQDFISQAKGKIKETEDKQLAPAGSAKTAPAAQKPKENGEYSIGVDDVLFISVWQNQDLNQEVTVRPDGKIAVLLIGDTQAEGLTVSQLTQAIKDRIKDYIKYPEVSIALRKIGGKKVIILGEIGSPGVYSVSGKTTVLELIGLAHGYTPNAVLSSVLVIRGGLQKPVGQKVDLLRAIKTADLSQNIVLEPEDIVYVPKSFISNMNYVMTMILSPISQGIYTTQAIQNWKSNP